MKTKSILLLVLPVLLVFFSFRAVEDIIAKLGLSHDNAQSHILAHISGGFSGEFGDDTFFRLPYSKLLPSVVAGDRTAATRELLEYIRRYCNSEEFMAAYVQKRNALKPTSEPPRMEEEVLENLRMSLKEMETMLKELKQNPKENAQTIAVYEEMVSGQRAQLAEWEDPTPNLTKWKKKFPEDPAVMVKSKLEAYLALVGTVDFNAKLTEPDKYKIKKFVNPTYESKSEAWKATYRAGKEVNDVTKVFVQDWLQGEIIAANKVSMPKEAQVKSGNVNKGVVGNTSPEATDTAAPKEEVKTKKSLLGKLRDKAKDILE